MGDGKFQNPRNFQDRGLRRDTFQRMEAVVATPKSGANRTPPASRTLRSRAGSAWIELEIAVVIALVLLAAFMAVS